jgi:hypothetical protein
MKMTRGGFLTVWRRAFVSALLGVVTMAGAAGAQPVPASLDERIAGAARVVVATTRSVEARWEQNAHGDRLIVSRFLLEVSETLKGGSGKAVWLDLDGGTLDGLTLRVSSLPSLQPGERAVFFLEPGTGVAFQPHLRGQGILRLDEQDMVRGTSLPLSEIRARARGLER